MFFIGCIDPYLEYRYDAKWKEASVCAGVLFNWGKCFNSHEPAEKRCPHF